MNIGIRLHDIEAEGFEGKLKRAKELGFGCIHLAMGKAVDGFSMDKAPELLTRQYAQTVKALAEKYQMRIAVLGCYLNLATPDLEQLSRTIEIYKAHLHFGKWIGAVVVGTETGAPNVQYKTTTDCFTQEALDLFVERLGTVMQEAERAGMPLAIEPVVRHIVNTPQRTKAVLDAIASPLCRVILDPVNLLDEANVDNQKEIFAQALTLFGERTQVVHWKDYVVKNGTLQSVAAGYGQLDADEVVRWMARRPNVYVTLEDTDGKTVEAARDSLMARLS